MSWEAVDWANKQRLRLPQEQFVLLMLANCADPEGVAFSWWKKREHWWTYLVERTRLSRATVFRHLNTLERAGLLTRVKLATTDGGAQYVVHLKFEVNVNQEPEDGGEPDSQSHDETESHDETQIESHDETDRVSIVRLQENTLSESMIPPNPPPGGGQAELRREMEESFKPFAVVYPAPVTDMAKALDVWEKLGLPDRADAILGAKGYGRFLAEQERKRKPRAVKDAHRWLKDRMWVGYLTAGQAAEMAAARVDIREGSDAWQAWDVFYRCCGWSSGIPVHAITGAPGSRIANVPCDLPPVGQGLNPDRSGWMRVTEGGGPFAAWMRRLRELPNVRINPDRDPATGKQALRVPQEWPPAKHIQPSATAPPLAPQPERHLAHERR